MRTPACVCACASWLEASFWRSGCKGGASLANAPIGAGHAQARHTHVLAPRACMPVHAHVLQHSCTQCFGRHPLCQAHKTYSHSWGHAACTACAHLHRHRRVVLGLNHAQHHERHQHVIGHLLALLHTRAHTCMNTSMTSGRHACLQACFWASPCPPAHGHARLHTNKCTNMHTESNHGRARGRGDARCSRQGRAQRPRDRA